MTAPKLVSVVLPVYNQAHFLPAALDGVFAQTYPLLELIVVNDGSTDGTAQVLAHYRERHEFTVISQENQGLPRALNAGFARARGDYLTWTSSDNVMLPEMLTSLATALDNNPQVGLVYADFSLLDEDGHDLGLLTTAEYDPHLLLHANLVHCCFLYRRACMERVGGYDPAFRYSEDWEYWIRISRFYRMQRVPQMLYRYRFHRMSMTSEIERQTAHAMRYAEFAAHMRRRMPWRWWLGKAKWWGLRFLHPAHPLLAERAIWQRAIRQAAGSPGES